MSKYNLVERGHLESLSVDERIILLKGVLDIELGRMDWIDLAQERDVWQAVMNAVMNIRAP